MEKSTVTPKWQVPFWMVRLYALLRSIFVRPMHSPMAGLLRLHTPGKPQSMPTALPITVAQPQPSVIPMAGVARRRITWRGLLDLYYSHALLNFCLIVGTLFLIAIGWSEWKYNQRLNDALAHPMTQAKFMSDLDSPMTPPVVSGTVRVATKDKILVEFGTHDNPMVYDLTVVRWYLENAHVALPKAGDLLSFYWRNPDLAGSCPVPFWANAATLDKATSVLCVGVGRN